MMNEKIDNLKKKKKIDPLFFFLYNKVRSIPNKHTFSKKVINSNRALPSKEINTFFFKKKKKEEKINTDRWGFFFIQKIGETWGNKGNKTGQNSSSKPVTRIIQQQENEREKSRVNLQHKKEGNLWWFSKY